MRAKDKRCTKLFLVKMEEYTHLNWIDHSAILLSKLHNMFETNAFVDLSLASDEGLSIQVHRVVLCAASQYFQELLSQHPIDAPTTIILSNVSFEHLRALVEFIYKGTVSVPRSQLPLLLESAISMKIKGLADTIKCSQQQNDSRTETDQPESEGTFLKIVSVKSIAQMPSRSDEATSRESIDEVVKEEPNYDSDVTLVYEPEENNLMSDFGAIGSALNEPLQVSLSNSLTNESPGKKSNRSSYCKRKKNQQHSFTGTDAINIPTRSTLFKRKSSSKDEEGSAGSEQQAKEPLVALGLTILAGDSTPPAPILFKRDPSMTEEEKEQEEISHRDDDMQSEDLVTDLFDDEADSYEEEKSTDSTDEDYATASTSNKLKTKVNSTAEKQKSQPKPQSRVPNGTFSCDVCLRRYKKKTNLDQHLKYRCGKEPAFSCTLCKVRTVWKSDLKKHLVRVHKISDSQFASHGVGPKIYPEMPFKCHKCQRSYKLKGDLNRHLKECGLHPRFRCTQCDYRAKRKAHLSVHLKSVHSISPADFAAHGIGCAFQCNICLFSCDRNVALQKHMASKHTEK